MKITLRTFLTIPNIEIVRPNRFSCAAIPDDVVAVREWKGFNLQHVDRLFGHLLDQECDMSGKIEDYQPLDAGYLLDSDADFGNILIQNNFKIVNKALRAVFKHLDLEPLSCVRGTMKRSYMDLPDWVGQAYFGTPNAYDYVCGESRLMGDFYRDVELAGPILRQAASYSVRNGLGCSFVLTNQQLFLSRHIQATSPEMLETVSIPWDTSDGLTVNLALFAFLLMARIVAEPQTRDKLIDKNYKHSLVLNSIAALRL